MVTVFSDPAGEDPIGEVARLVTLRVVTVDAEGQCEEVSFTCTGIDYQEHRPYFTMDFSQSRALNQLHF